MVLKARVCCQGDSGTGGEGMLSWRPWYWRRGYVARETGTEGEGLLSGRQWYWRRGYVVMETVVMEARVCCQGDCGTGGEGVLSWRPWYWRQVCLLNLLIFKKHLKLITFCSTGSSRWQDCYISQRQLHR